MWEPDSIQANRSPHASLGNDDADQAGPFFSSGFSFSSLSSFDDEEKALRDLQVHGYYRFRIYWLALLQDTDASDEARFEHVLDAMHFDEELGNLILRLIAPVEIAFRSSLARALTEEAGEHALERQSLFANAGYYSQMKSILTKEYAHAKRGNGCPPPRKPGNVEDQPVWLLLEIASMGTISKMFCNLADANVRRKTAAAFGVKPYLLENWMRCLTILRNICAHNGWLYGRNFNIRPVLFREHSKVDRSKCFAYLLLLMRLHGAVRPDEADEMRLRLRSIVEAHQGVNLSQLGFPKNWKQLLGIPTAAADGPRARGTRGGRPPKDPAAIEKALYLYDLETDSIAEIARKTGVGPTTLYKYIKLRKEAQGM